MDSDYMRHYRETNPTYRSEERLRQQAYGRALRTFAKANPRAFRKVLNAERAIVGLPPVGTLRPGPKRKTEAA